jgi:DNA-binding beta-propeller fold protein YncE
VRRVGWVGAAVLGAGALALILVLALSGHGPGRPAGGGNTAARSSPPGPRGVPLPRARSVRAIADGSPPCTTVAHPGPSLARVRTAMVGAGVSPFGVVVSGGWSFVSEAGSVAVFSDAGFAPRLVRTVRVPGAALGEAITPDRRNLLVAGGAGATVLSVPALERGSAGAVLGSLTAHGAFVGAAIEVAITADGRYAFVSLEASAGIAVFDLASALRSGLRSSGYVGTIPVANAPVGLALSSDGRYLYATSETLSPTTQTGALSVISVAAARRTPARSVLVNVAAGCSPVRVLVDGARVWVAARASDALLGFSAARLISQPARAIVARVTVGEAPVGLAALDGGRELAVADSDRFATPGAHPSLSIVNVAAALPRVEGRIRSGSFPRQLALEPDGSVLLVTNNASGQLEAVGVAGLPGA